jgi:hypothetical protein
MSWETFVVGTLEIVSGVPEEKKAKIVEDFEEVLETDLIWDDHAKEYKVSHINWMSHVTEEEIKKCHQKHKRHIKYKSPNTYSKTFVSLNNLTLSCVFILSNFDPYLIAFG